MKAYRLLYVYVLPCLVALFLLVHHRPPTSQNFVFITIDTLRRDHLGCYGSTVVQTPNLDYLAEEGTLFENYYAAANCTVPSHLSLFSGYLPSDLGIFDNEKYDVSSVPLISDHLKNNGYRTVGIAAAFMFHTGWLKGFGDRFDVFQAPSEGEWRGDRIVELFREILPRIANRKFFVWLHFYDPHEPYDPPENYLQLYGARKLKGETVPDHARPQWLDSFGIKRRWQVRARYRGEVSYTDDQIGLIRKLLMEHSLDQNTITIVVADHGEMLGEWGRFYTHATLYEPTTHVPLIIHGPGIQKRRVSDPASSIDLFPTILEWSGIEPSEKSGSQSLVPLLRGERASRTRTLYVNSAYDATVAVIRPPYKLIYNKPDTPEISGYQLYNLEQDPWEQKNLIATEAYVATAIRELSDPVWEPLQKRRAIMSPEEEDRLRALGYFQ